MPVVFNGDVLKLNVGMTLFNQPLQISHHFRMQDETLQGADSFVDLWTQYAATPRTALQACMSADVTIVSGHVEDIINTNNPNLQRRSHDFNSASVGTNGAAGTTDVSQTCAVISWRTGFSGRGEQGRSYIPGLAHTDIVAGRLNSAGGGIIDRLNTYATDLLAAFDGNSVGSHGWRLVLWRQHLTNPDAFEGMAPDASLYPVAPHYEFNPRTRRPFNPLAAAHTIDTFLVRDRVRTQRRRGIDVRIGRRH